MKINPFTNLPGNGKCTSVLPLECRIAGCIHYIFHLVSKKKKEVESLLVFQFWYKIGAGFITTEYFCAGAMLSSAISTCKRSHLTPDSWTVICIVREAGL